MNNCEERLFQFQFVYLFFVCFDYINLAKGITDRDAMIAATAIEVKKIAFSKQLLALIAWRCVCVCVCESKHCSKHVVC